MRGLSSLRPFSDLRFPHAFGHSCMSSFPFRHVVAPPTRRQPRRRPQQGKGRHLGECARALSVCVCTWRRPTRREPRSPTAEINHAKEEKQPRGGRGESETGSDGCWSSVEASAPTSPSAGPRGVANKREQQRGPRLGTRVLVRPRCRDYLRPRCPPSSLEPELEHCPLPKSPGRAKSSLFFPVFFFFFFSRGGCQRWRFLGCPTPRTRQHGHVGVFSVSCESL